jgi:hypothetical protein
MRPSKIRQANPSIFRWSILHIVVLVGIYRKEDIRAFVLDDVLKTAPSRAISSILWPYERLGGLDVPEFASILKPPALRRTPLRCTVSGGARNLTEVIWMMGWVKFRQFGRHRCEAV